MPALTFPAVLAAAADEAPDAEALAFGDVRLTFAQLQQEVRRFARAALAAGLQPGDRAAIWAPNSDRWVVAALGLVSVGAVLVPVNTRFKGEEAQHVLADTGARLLLVDDSFLDADRVAMLERAEPLPALERLVRLDSDDWDGFLAGGESVAAAEAEKAAASVRPDDVSDLIFTSGTTGRPKGVMVTHEQGVRLFTTWAQTVGLRRGDRMLVVAPFFHTFGYKAGMLACLLQRATLLPVQVFDVPRTMALVQQERVTVIPGPPTLYSTLLEHPERSSYDLSSVRLAVTGASVVPTELIRRMRQELGFEMVLTAYGLTECGGYATGCRQGDPDEVISLTSGRAIDGVEVRVVDEQGADVAGRRAGRGRRPRLQRHAGLLGRPGGDHGRR